MKPSNIKKTVLCFVMIAAVAVSALDMSVFAQRCSDIRGRVLRLHILANSDSNEDQALKLQVRDRILEYSPKLFGNAKSKDDAEQSARRSLTAIRSVAEKEVRREGFSYPVKARIVNMYFTTRTYGNITLPAGNYDAVRITIGAAEGHNWWCVLFPPLCLPAAEKQVKVKTVDDVLKKGEVCIVKNGGKPETIIKFKSLELLEEASDAIKKFFKI